MVVGTCELAKKLVNQELLIFFKYYGCKRYQMPFGVVKET
jgi:hypothetical protein